MKIPRRATLLGLAPVLVACLVSLSLPVTHAFRNRGLLPWDSNDYFSFAQSLHKRYLQEGSAQFLKALLLERHWKPLFHPFLVLPAIFATHQNVPASIALTSGLFYFIFLLVSGILLLEFLPPLESAIGVVFVGTSPWILAAGVTFFSEIYFLAFLTLLLLSVKKSRDLSHRGWSLCAGAMFGFMAMCRPVEPIMIFTLPISVYFFVLFKKRRISGPELLWTVGSLALGVVYVGFGVVSGRQSLVSFLPPYFTLQALMTLAYMKARKKADSTHLVPALSVSFAMVALWYTPGIGNLWSWIYQSGIDPNMNPGGNSNPFAFFKDVFLEDGGLPLTVLFLISLVGLRVKTIKGSLRTALFVTISACVPFLIGVQTQNPDTRYYLGVFLVLDLIALGIALQPRFPARPARVAGVAALVATQYYYCLLHVTSQERPQRLVDFFHGPARVLEPLTREDPFRFAVGELIRALPTTSSTHFFLCPISSGDYRDEAADNTTWWVAAQERGRDWNIAVSKDHRPAFAQEITEAIEAKTDYFLVLDPGTSAAGPDRSAVGLKLLEGAHGKHGAVPVTVIPWTSYEGLRGKIWVFSAKPALEFLRARAQPTSATTSISTRTSLGSRETSTVERAGGSALK